MKKLPRWKLESIYKGLDHNKYNQDLKKLSTQIQKMSCLIKSAPKNKSNQLAWLERYIDLYNNSNEHS